MWGSSFVFSFLFHVVSRRIEYLFHNCGKENAFRERKGQPKKIKKKSGFVTLNSFISCGKNDFVRREVNFFTCASRYRDTFRA